MVLISLQGDFKTSLKVLTCQLFYCNKTKLIHVCSLEILIVVRTLRGTTSYIVVILRGRGKWRHPLVRR